VENLIWKKEGDWHDWERAKKVKNENENENKRE